MSFDLDLERAHVAVVGLGYVGLPLAVALGRELPTLGFDIDAHRVAALAEGRDANGETDTADLRAAKQLHFSCDANALRECDVFIIAVPTPVTPHKWPDLKPLIAASETVGRILRR